MKTLFESSNSKGLSKISCIKYKNLTNLSHYHSDYELIYVNEGSAQISVNEHLINVHEKESVFVHSNDIHHIHADGETVITVLKADQKFFETIFARKTLASPLISKDIPVEHFLEAVYAEIKRGDENRDMMANCMTVQFFITLLRGSKTVERKSESSGRMSTHEIYRELCKKIADEYATITFEDAARHMKFSEPHFSKVFHNIFGMTFTRYLNTVKIAAALEKIRQGHMNITEIAYSCGFNTIRNFNRVFKNFTGYSPKSIPSDYVFPYNLQDGYGLDPTLNCTIVMDE